MSPKSFILAVSLLSVYAGIACASPVPPSACSACASDTVETVSSSEPSVLSQATETPCREDQPDIVLAVPSSTEFSAPVTAALSDGWASGGARPVDLPPLPGGLALAFLGFLCLSAVRDRAFWYGAAVRTVTLAHAGVCALPRLAASLSSNVLPGLAPSWCLAGDSAHLRPRIVWPEIEFVGLLRRLASKAADSAPSVPMPFGQVSLIAVGNPLSGPAAFSFCPAAVAPRGRFVLDFSGAAGVLRLRCFTNRKQVVG